jgi:hypothetical protein
MEKVLLMQKQDNRKESFTSIQSKGIHWYDFGSGKAMDRTAEVQRDGRARQFDILFNTTLFCTALRILNNHEMSPMLVGDPKAAKLYRSRRRRPGN